MLRKLVIGALGAMAVLFSTTGIRTRHRRGSQSHASEKTVAAMKADKAKTIELINKGEGGFLDRDLYPFCANVSDGVRDCPWQP